MVTKFEKLKQELKERNKQRKQSPLEEWVLRFFSLAKIFGYELEYQVDYYFIDIAFPELKFGVELDGKEFHQNKERDESRDEYLKNKGWEIMRIPSEFCWRPTNLAYFLKKIHQKVNGERAISWGLAEMLGQTENLICRRQPVLEFCEICKHHHEEDSPCVKNYED